MGRALGYGVERLGVRVYALASYQTLPLAVKSATCQQTICDEVPADEPAAQPESSCGSRAWRVPVRGARKKDEPQQSHRQRRPRREGAVQRREALAAAARGILRTMGTAQPGSRAPRSLEKRQAADSGSRQRASPLSRSTPPETQRRLTVPRAEPVQPRMHCDEQPDVDVRDGAAEAPDHQERADEDDLPAEDPDRDATEGDAAGAHRLGVCHLRDPLQPRPAVPRPPRDPLERPPFWWRRHDDSGAVAPRRHADGHTGTLRGGVLFASPAGGLQGAPFLVSVLLLAKQPRVQQALQAAELPFEACGRTDGEMNAQRQQILARVLRLPEGDGAVEVWRQERRQATSAKRLRPELGPDGDAGAHMSYVSRRGPHVVRVCWMQGLWCFARDASKRAAIGDTTKTSVGKTPLQLKLEGPAPAESIVSTAWDRPSPGQPPPPSSAVRKRAASPFRRAVPRPLPRRLRRRPPLARPVADGERPRRRVPLEAERLGPADGGVDGGIAVNNDAVHGEDLDVSPELEGQP
eukprot:gene3156-biopygen5288